MGKFKAALVDSYAGAILIALVASNGITNLIQPIFTTMAALVSRARTGDSPNYGPEVAVFIVVHAFVYLLIAFLLLRWLYFPIELPLDDVAPESDSEA